MRITHLCMQSMQFAMGSFTFGFVRGLIIASASSIIMMVVSSLFTANNR